MLTSFKELQGYEVFTTEGKVGAVEDIYFDDAKWGVRYLIVNTGAWMHRRQVLVSPWAVNEVAKVRDAVMLNLNRESVENSPEIQFDEPVSRQMEKKYFDYYSWPYYWEGTGLWGASPYPGIATGMLSPAKALPSEIQKDLPEVTGDPHLRSSKELMGYHLQTDDGEFGHVKDIIIDDHTWAVRYMVIDTGNWWYGKTFLIAPQWISDIRWSEQKVYISLSKEHILKSPEYGGLEFLDRNFENRLYEHFGYVNGKYWLLEGAPEVIHKPEPRTTIGGTHGREKETTQR